MKDALHHHDRQTEPRAHILHAEDSIPVAACVQRFFSAEGYHVVTAANGGEALARVLKQPGVYDLVITDHSMPEVTGLQWLKVLRGIGYPGRIIVFAAGLPPDVESQFLSLGVDRIILKSGNFDALRRAVEELLSAPSSLGE